MRNLLLNETKQLLREGDPTWAASQGALEALRTMVDDALGGKMRNPNKQQDPRTAVLAIINACVKSRLINAQQANKLREDHDLDLYRDDIGGL